MEIWTFVILGFFSFHSTSANDCKEENDFGFCNNIEKPNQPNIILFLADDMGWNDAGWHNKDIYSPNMVSLVTDGIQLNNSYLLPYCSPSRSSLLTGYYSFRTGIQDKVICGTIPVGLPLKFPTLANRLKDLGYATHLIGKWNLGTCHQNYTPTYRGFDTFFGYLQSVQHYYTHLTYVSNDDTRHSGYDFRNNTKIEWQYMGIHSSIAYVKQAKHVIETHDRSKPLFLYFAAGYPHVPHEVPQEFEDLYQNSSVKNPDRRKFMARISALDHDVGQVIALLKQNGLYDNSVIAFSSDNGGNPYSGGNNWPLRGGKTTYYEGGTRVPGFIHSPLLPKKSFVYNGLMHAVDWVPTLVAVAGGTTDSDIDGINLWPAITQNSDSPRTELVYNLIANDKEVRGAIRVGDWKLIIGQAGTPSSWYLPEDVNGTFSSHYYELDIEIDLTTNNSLQLFNLKEDPTERRDESLNNPSKVEHLLNIFKKYKQSSVTPINLMDDPAGDPANFHGVFTPGWCEPIVDPVLYNLKFNN